MKKTIYCVAIASVFMLLGLAQSAQAATGSVILAYQKLSPAASFCNGNGQVQLFCIDTLENRGPTNYAKLPAFEGQTFVATAIVTNNTDFFFRWSKAPDPYSPLDNPLYISYPPEGDAAQNYTLLAWFSKRTTGAYNTNVYPIGYGDIDCDWLADDWEVYYSCLNPTSKLGNVGTYGNPDNDFLPAGFNGSMTYPLNYDSASGYKPQTTAKFHNYYEFAGFDGIRGTIDDPGTDPCDDDTDNDTLLDGWEYYFWVIGHRWTNNTVGHKLGFLYDTNAVITTNDVLYWFDPLADNGSANQDIDGDCLSNYQEMMLGTDPLEWDTDGDGLADGWEVENSVNGSLNPLKYDSDGNGTGDGQENPDGDWMAIDKTTPDTNVVHKAVYNAFGFDPRTSWGQKFSYVWQFRSTDPRAGSEDAPNTMPYDNLHEYYGPDNRPPENCNNWGSTNPNNRDTDGGGIDDGWELYVGLNPFNKDDDTENSDAPADDLSNLEEFQCRAMGTEQDPEWLNKIWPTDPFNGDTDGDQSSDSGEKAFRYCGGVSNWNGHCYVGGGMNPTSVDTDGDHIPDAWESVYRGNGMSLTDHSKGMDGTYDDSTDQDFDDDGLINYQEYWAGAVYHWQYPDWMAGLGLGGYDPWDFFAGQPNHWDWHYWADADIHKVPDPNMGGAGIPFKFIVGVSHPSGLWFSTLDPNTIDTDGDTMDDFYETYHGLNPIFGTYDIYASKIAGGWVLAGLPATLDVRVWPYINGSQYLDSDQDGLPNAQEALQANPAVPGTFYHTDPTPLWITDHSYQQSWPNLYYSLGTFNDTPGQWWWDDAVMRGVRPPPTYVYSFESVEGFDTDNDNLGDRAELVNSSSPGCTDPLDVQSPPRRRALHLNGDAAARTRGQFYHNSSRLINFTVETWIRPANPASGAHQIIIERPIEIENGNPMGWPEQIRVNFRLAIDPAGYPYIGYNGSGYDALFVEAKATGANVLPANEWTHLAGTYDATNNMLKLYKNGELVAATPSGEDPFNGWIQGNPGWVHVAPFVVGAKDDNPNGWVDGAPIWVGPYAGYMPGQPVLSQFYNGWVDEIRIWDGAKTEGQIQADMMTRMNRASVQASINARNAQGMAAAELLYLYTFDDLPSPQYSSVAPEGFELLNGRPNDGSYPSVMWWATATDKSLVYNNYLYIPWIENTAAHLPLDPPADSMYWNIVQTNLVVSGTNLVKVVTTNVFPNASNPYNFGYYHGIRATLENHPDYLNSAYLLFNSYQSAMFNDLLPLRYAEADESIDLWDGLGPGLTDVDDDDDGMPNEWEIAYGLNPLDPTDAYVDTDGDGLYNLNEYLAGTSPVNVDTLGTGLRDGQKDSDGDGLANIDEQNSYGTNVGDPDTDDDGLADGAELLSSTIKGDRHITSPMDSRSPIIRRSAVMTGTALMVPDVLSRNGVDRFALNKWTIEAWVYLASASESGAVLARVLDDGRTNFALRVDGNRPAIEFTSAGGSKYTAGGTVTMPANTWFHLAGVWNPDAAALELFINGYSMQAVPCLEPPAIGAGKTTAGRGLHGYLDELRVWDTARTATEVAFWHRRNLFDMARISSHLPPVDIVFLIDVTGSMYPYIQKVKENVTDFVMALNNLGMNARVAGVQYQDTLEGGWSNDAPPTGSAFFTNSSDFVTLWLDPLQVGGGGDLPEDGLGALTYAMGTYKFRADAQRVYILITDAAIKDTEDGETGAIQSRSSVIKALVSSNIVVYGVYRNQADITDVVVSTGGKSYSVDADDYAGIFDSIVLQISSTAVRSHLRAYYTFDDGQNQTVTNKINGLVTGRGAEDSTYPLDWRYAITNLLFATNPAVAIVTAADLNGNQIPDWWEALFFGGYVNAAEDYDGDGLNNLYEFFCDTNPKFTDSDNDMILDPDEDRDGDGMPNILEQKYSSDPQNPDADDDNIADGQELNPAFTNGGRLVTSPTDSRSPVIQRSLALSGTGYELPGMGDTDAKDRFDLRAWTIEAWVRLSSASESGSIIRRRLLNGQTNFALNVSANKPLVMFTTSAGVSYMAGANSAIPPDTWTHLAGVWNPSNRTLQLFVNGVQLQALVCVENPATGGGATMLGEGLNGYVDEVRVWNWARDARQIAMGRDVVVNAPWFSGINAITNFTFTNTMQILDELVGQGGGVLVEDYSGTVSNTPILAGSFLLDVGGYLYQDNGIGTLFGPGSGDFGTIDYASGYWQVHLQSHWIDTNKFILATYKYGQGDPIHPVVSSYAMTNSVQGIGLVANYRFDDGVNTTVVNPLIGGIQGFGAEDYVNRSNWQYAAISAVGFTTNTFADLMGYDDIDEDGVGDWWQALFWTNFNPLAQVAGLQWAPQYDMDGDGLMNLYEFWADTNPRDWDTDNDGMLDTDEDRDGDGLANGTEQTYQAHPALPDTDDDGLTDSFEVRKGVSPINSLSPAVDRALSVAGGTNDYVLMPNDLRFGLRSFTIAAWVNPTTIPNNSQIVSREVEPGVFNYCLGWWTDPQSINRIAIKFNGGGEKAQVLLWASNAVPLSAWTHVAATYNATNGELLLYVNGSVVRSNRTEKVPMYNSTGPGIGMVGKGMNGLVDEVVLCNRALRPSEVANVMNKVGMTNISGMVGYYRFDDSTYTNTTSGAGWNYGQVEDFAGPLFGNADSEAIAKYNLGDWERNWRDAGTLRGAATLTASRMTPGVLYVTSPNLDGVYYPGQTVTVWVVFSRPVAQVSGIPYITLRLEGATRNAYYKSYSGSTVAFEYPIQNKDWSWDLDYINTTALVLNGGVIRYSTSPNLDFDLTLPVPSTYGSLGWTKDLLIDPPDGPVQATEMLSKWVTSFFGDNPVDWNADPDNDGMTNYEEFLANTDPFDDASVMDVTDVRIDNGVLVIEWAAKADRRYTIQYRESLGTDVWTSPALWSSLPFTNEIMTVTDDGILTGGFRMKYYRVIVNP